MSKVQVYCAISLDGFLAGPDDDLSWLNASNPEPAELGTIGFPAFMAQTGVMLMGRQTFDVVMSFGVDWPYGATPVLIATSRPLPDDAPTTVMACSGDIRALCEQAKEIAGDKKNVYLDGGSLISQALDAGCVDELILTVAPVLLGRGAPLYRGESLQRFNAEPLGRLGELLQMKLTPEAK